MVRRRINVDASEDAIRRFHRSRKRDINDNVGIGQESGALDYYKMSSWQMHTISREFAKKAEQTGVRIIEVVKVSVVTLRALLDEYLPCGQHIDFMSIDCEGLDLSILQSNDWTRYRPDFILVEIHSDGKSWEIPTCSVTLFMNEQGYEFAGQGVVTTLYKRVG